MKRTHKVKIEKAREAAKVSPEEVRRAKCTRTKERNAARKALRRERPELRGRKLNRWPIGGEAT